MLDQMKNRSSESFQTLLEFLTDVGVPESSIQNLREKLTITCASDTLTHRNRSIILQNMQANTGDNLKRTNKTIDALVMAQDYSKCYPYMNAMKMVQILLDAWENFCALKDADKSQIQRKYSFIKTDKKERADPLLLSNLDDLLKEVTGEQKTKRMAQPWVFLMYFHELIN